MWPTEAGLLVAVTSLTQPLHFDDWDENEVADPVRDRDYGDFETELVHQSDLQLNRKSSTEEPRMRYLDSHKTSNKDRERIGILFWLYILRTQIETRILINE